MRRHRKAKKFARINEIPDVFDYIFFITKGVSVFNNTKKPTVTYDLIRPRWNNLRLLQEL